jgi:hypothetical protein
MEAHEFPVSITHNGLDYYATGKTATNVRNCKRVAEMEAADASRIWVALDGTAYPE